MRDVARQRVSEQASGHHHHESWMMLLSEIQPGETLLARPARCCLARSARALLLLSRRLRCTQRKSIRSASLASSQLRPSPAAAAATAPASAVCEPATGKQTHRYIATGRQVRASSPSVARQCLCWSGLANLFVRCRARLMGRRQPPPPSTYLLAPNLGRLMSASQWPWALNERLQLLASWWISELLRQQTVDLSDGSNSLCGRLENSPTTHRRETHLAKR